MSNVFNNLDWSFLTDMLLAVVPALLCITIHEFSHGLVALKLGDTTARDMGRLSLNPLKHIDFFGLVMMAAVGFGWAKPVPINMRRFKNPKRGMAVSALAGPVSNIVLAIVALFIFGFLFQFLADNTAGYYVLFLLQKIASLSIALAIFNILPIPPLDGSKVVFSLVSDEAYFKLMRYERYGMFILIALLVSGVIDGPLHTALSFVYYRLYFAALLGDRLSKLIF